MQRVLQYQTVQKEVKDFLTVNDFPSPSPRASGARFAGIWARSWLPRPCAGRSGRPGLKTFCPARALYSNDTLTAANTCPPPWLWSTLQSTSSSRIPRCLAPRRLAPAGSSHLQGRALREACVHSTAPRRQQAWRRRTPCLRKEERKKTRAFQTATDPRSQILSQNGKAILAACSGHMPCIPQATVSKSWAGHRACLGASHQMT